MGKRSDFARVPRDFYITPSEAVEPLLPHLAPGTQYIEPCAGNRALIGHLNAAGHICRAAFDIEPQAEGLAKADALEFRRPPFIPYRSYTIITNPPWDRRVLHAMIAHLTDQHPTWLLFDADWVHTRQAAPYLPLLRKIVSVGRVKWIADSPFTGKDNCAWHLFDREAEGPAQFIGRAA